MSSLERKLITPQSVVIEKMALELAANFWEIGKSQGLKSKHKDARSYAKRYVEKFIPLAVNYAMDILANPSTPQDQRDLLYDAILERANDKDLANSGIPVFENPLAATFIPDTKDTRGGPLIGTSPKKHKGRIEDLPLDTMLFDGRNFNG